MVCYNVWLMDRIAAEEFAGLYARFQAPLAALDCGQRCAPYNEGGAPFCCDTRHAVPAAYLAEWSYLQANTDLWHLWEGRTLGETEQLEALAPEGQVLIACLGYQLCQRDFRSLTCRAFPFFPYLTRQGQFIGLSVYWEYEECCWVINNLQVVSGDSGKNLSRISTRFYPVARGIGSFPPVLSADAPGLREAA